MLKYYDCPLDLFFVTTTLVFDVAAVAISMTSCGKGLLSSSSVSSCGVGHIAAN